jgi:hypothetical protein
MDVSMILYDNNIVDNWWDTISAKLTRYNYEAHGLTPEILKYLCLQNQLLCLSIDELVIFGTIEYKPNKSFNIVYLEGKNLIDAFAILSDYLKKNYCFECTGVVNQNLAHKVHFKGLEEYGLNANKHYLYEIDLSKYELTECDKELVLLQQSNYYHELPTLLDKSGQDSQYLENNILQGNMISIRIADSYIVGHKLISGGKKLFYISESIDIDKSNLDAFINFVSKHYQCRFVTLRSVNKLSFLDDLDILCSFHLTIKI